MMYLDLEGDVEDAVDRLMAGYEEKQVSHFVKEAQQKGALPYKVVLHGMLQVGCLEHDCAGEEVWEVLNSKTPHRDNDANCFRVLRSI